MANLLWFLGSVDQYELTLWDTRPLLKKHEGTRDFTKKYFPKLIDSVKNLKICHLSAVQVGSDNLPKINSEPFNLLAPIEYCIETLTNNQKQNKTFKRRSEYINMQKEKFIRHERKNAAINYSMAIIVISFFVYLFYYIFSFMWPYLLQKWIPVSPT